MTRFPTRFFTKTALLVGFCLSSLSHVSVAFAYIPHSQTIVGRLIKNSGRGNYVVEQEVKFRTAGDPITLRERWVVENGETMRLLVSGPQTSKTAEPIHFEATYSGGKKTAPDLSQSTPSMRTAALSPEFSEGLFHSRSSGGFFSALYRSRIVPPGTFRERPRFAKAELAKYPAEPLVRLGRTGGVLTWIFGNPTPRAGQLSSAAWIEQDAFQLRRVRFPTEAEISADKFTSYSNNLRLPRERTITWGNNSVLIRVLSVKSGSAPANDKATRGTYLPDLAQVKEFYTRFR